MIFWLAVLAGAMLAWIAVRIGFYASWIMLFHLALAVCLAIFLTPVVVAGIPEAATIQGYGHALTMLSIAMAVLLIAYGTCFACLSGRISMPFPRFFDTIVAGILGFQAGFLVCSFFVLAFSLTPLAHLDFFKQLGFDQKAQRANTAYVCWWSDRLHSFMAPLGDESTSRQAIELLLKKTALPSPPAAVTPELPPPSPQVDVNAAPAADQYPAEAEKTTPKDRGKREHTDGPEQKLPGDEHPPSSTFDDPFAR